MKAEDLMRRNVATIGPLESVGGAAKVMAEKNIGDLIVVDEGWPIGIITERDIVAKVIAKDRPLSIPVEDVMSSGLITVDVDTDADRLPAIMEKHSFRRLPVIEGKDLVGVITIRDLIKHKEAAEGIIASLVKREIW